MQDNVIISTRSFDAKRWINYFRLYTGVNRSQLLMCSMLLPAAMLVFTTLLFPSTLPAYENAVNAYYSIADRVNLPSYFLYYCILLLGVTLFASFMFSSVRGKDKSLRCLVTPASQFEKWLTYFIIYIVGFWVVFVLSMSITEGYRLLVTALSGYDKALVAEYISPADLLGDIDEVPSGVRALIYSAAIYSVLILQGVYALGSIYFRRFSYVITTLILGALSIIVPLLSVTTTILALDDDMVPREWMNDTWALFWVVTVSCVTMIVFLYALGYSRFRETEIIDKW